MARRGAESGRVRTVGALAPHHTARSRGRSRILSNDAVGTTAASSAPGDGRTAEDGAARPRRCRRGGSGGDAAYLATLGERAALDAAIHWYRAAGRSGLTAADVPAVTVPTLYVWGDADATVGRPAAEGTREFVKAPYRFVEVPGVGHFVTDQAPQVFPPLLLEQLRAGA